MFTGIIEELGTIEQIVPGTKSARLSVRAAAVLAGTRIGDSIAVNGVCLTVTEMRRNGFTADVMAETLRRSSLGELHGGSVVNLERAMAADGRFGGHIVSGHIDGTGTITRLEREDNAVWMTIQTKAAQLRYIVEKGSIAIDGVSLTVATVSDTGFQVSLIPHTAKETTLLSKSMGATVNLENDIISKYIEKLMQEGYSHKGNDGQETSGITTDFLNKYQF